MGGRGEDDGREGRLMRPVVFATAIAVDALLGLSVTSPAASAQDWPSRPSRSSRRWPPAAPLTSSGARWAMR